MNKIADKKTTAASSLEKTARIMAVLVLSVAIVCMATHRYTSLNRFYTLFTALSLIHSKKLTAPTSKIWYYSVMIVGCAAYVLVSCFFLGKAFGHGIGGVF